MTTPRRALVGLLGIASALLLAHGAEAQALYFPLNVYGYFGPASP